MIWSIIGISNILPILLTSLVLLMSLIDGEQLPERWLWNRKIPVEWCLSPIEKICLRSMIVDDHPPDVTLSNDIGWYM